jgi:hypothetical protein
MLADVEVDMKIKVPDEDKPLPMSNLNRLGRLPKPLRDFIPRLDAALERERKRKGK